MSLHIHTCQSTTSLGAMLWTTAGAAPTQLHSRRCISTAKCSQALRSAFCRTRPCGSNSQKPRTQRGVRGITAATPEDSVPNTCNPAANSMQNHGSMQDASSDSTSRASNSHGANPTGQSSVGGNHGAGSDGGGASGGYNTAASDGSDLPWRRYPAWLKYWLWACVLLYLVSRTKWRIERADKERELKQEQAQEDAQQQEWDRFVKTHAKRR